MVEVPRDHPFHPFLAQGRPIILDGGLATTLEAAGHVLDDHLWSARLLLDAPADVADVHTAFLEAGADCIASATYQASFPGLERSGLSHGEAEALLRRSVRLAVDARDRFVVGQADSGSGLGRPPPLVAAGVGPYGAYLADGSEYTGAYDVDEDGLYAFHQERWWVLGAAGADRVACETIPSLAEVRALLRLVGERRSPPVWISFSCRDGGHLNDGTRVEEAARLCEAGGAEAVGVNCTAPAYVEELVRRIGAVTDLPVVAYPNSGEHYDAGSRGWLPGTSDVTWPDVAHAWVEAGAAAVGGCCRVGPGDIRALSDSFARS